MTNEETRNLYMQNPFEILTKEELDRLERHCKKAIHYERGHIREEHQVTLELIYKYQEQQTELEKKDKIIKAMVDIDPYIYRLATIKLKENKEEI